MRNAGDEGWSGWNFTDALEHFLKQTNIKIIGEIESPEEFKLK